MTAPLAQGTSIRYTRLAPLLWAASHSNQGVVLVATGWCKTAARRNLIRKTA